MKTGFSRKMKWLKCTCIVLLLSLLLAGCGSADEQIRMIADLNGKTIVTAIGSVHAAFVKERAELPDTEVSYALNNSSALAMLMAKKVDAFAADYVLAQRMTQNYGGLLILDEPLHNADYGLAFQKDDPRAEEFSEALAQLKTQGVLAELTEKWIGEGEKTVPAQTWPGTKGTLTCMVSGDEEPLCYHGGKDDPVGFDVELVLRIAEQLDYRIVFVESSFEDLIPSLMADQADLIASGITITPEREKQVSFTEPYMEAGTVLIVRDAGVSTTADGVWLSVKNSFHRVFVEEGRWRDMLRGLGLTLLMCSTTAITGLILGIGMYLWTYSGSKFAQKVFGGFSAFLGYLPPATWLLMIYYIVFSGSSVSAFWAAFAAFAVSFAFSVHGSLNAAIGSIPSGQSEAAISMGYNKYQALRKIYLPQALPAFFCSMQGAIVGHIKVSSLMEFVGLLDIQAVADHISGSTYETFMPIALTGVVYVVLTVLASRLVGKLGKRICPAEKEEEEIKRSLTKGDT